MKAAIHGHLKQLFLPDEIRCGMSLNTQTRGWAGNSPVPQGLAEATLFVKGASCRGIKETQCKQWGSLYPSYAQV